MKNIKINLLPPEIKQKRETENNIIYLGLYVVVVVVILLAWVFMLKLNVSTEQAKLESLQSQNAALEAQIGQFKEFEKKKEDYTKLKSIYDTLVNARVSWYRMMIEIALITPEQISLRNIALDEAAAQIQGECKTIQSLADYIVRLEELPELEEVWLDSFNIAGGKTTFILKATVRNSGAVKQ